MLTKSEIDPAELTAAVRRATDDPTFELLDWTLSVLSNGGSVNPDGLLRVDGQGCGTNGIRPWTLALKVIALAPPEVPPTHMGYFQRESIAYGEGALAALPGPLRAARCCGVTEEAGRARIWLELLAGRSGRDWDRADYTFAADQLAHFHAACIAANALDTAPWVGRDLARSWLSILPFDVAWADPHVRALFPLTLQRRLERFWAEHDRFLQASERLPQVFSHNDYKSRNLFIRPGAHGTEEIAAVDWGNCGLGPLGGDLAMLVSGTVFVLDWDPARIAELDAKLAAFDDAIARADNAYVRGSMTLGRYEAQLQRIHEDSAEVAAEKAELESLLVAETERGSQRQRLEETAQLGIAMLDDPDSVKSNAWLRTHVRVWVNIKEHKVYAVHWI